MRGIRKSGYLVMEGNNCNGTTIPDGQEKFQGSLIGYFGSIVLKSFVIQLEF